MGTTLIDSLVVTLGLNNSDFRRGQQQTEADLKKVRESGKATADDLESHGKRAANFFASLRTEVVGLFLAFAGAKGLKDFVGGIIQGDAAIGRFANNIGMATDQVAGWQGAVASVGGQASDADAALRKMADAYQNLIHLGQSGIGQELAGLGIKESDLAEGPDAMMRKVAEASKRFSPNDFRWRAERLGMSDSMITLLQKGRVNVAALVEEYQRLNGVTKEDADAAAAFQSAMNELEKSIKGAARPEVTALAGAMTTVVSAAEKADLVLPVLNGLMGALAIRTAVAAGPWILLAAAIAEAVIAYKEWHHIHNLSSKDKADLHTRDDARGKLAWDQIKKGDWGGFTSTWLEGVRDRMGSGSPPGATSGRPTANSGNAGNQIRGFFQSHGFSASQSQGILASIAAENRGLDPHARNPTSGAYGIGQWLSKNRVADFARVMGKPLQGSGLQDQLAFMLWEMQNTEHGAGAAVKGAGSTDAAALAMINRFYRPGGGTAGDIQRARAFNGGLTPGALVRGGGRGGAGGQLGGAAGSAMAQNVTVSGPITIYVPSGDPKAIARGLKGALDQRMVAVQANTGISG